MVLRASVLLDAALAARSDDVPALEAKAHLLWMRGRTTLARDAFQSGMALEPDNERLLEGAAALAGATGRGDEAVALLGLRRRGQPVLCRLSPTAGRPPRRGRPMGRVGPGRPDRAWT